MPRTVSRAGLAHESGERSKGSGSAAPAWLVLAVVLGVLEALMGLQMVDSRGQRSGV